MKRREEQNVLEDSPSKLAMLILDHSANVGGGSPIVCQGSLSKRPGSESDMDSRHITRGHSGFVLLASPPYSIFRPHSTACWSNSLAPRKSASIWEFHWPWRAATNVRSGMRCDAGIGVGISAAAFTKRSDKRCKLPGDMSVILQVKTATYMRTQFGVVVSCV